MNLLNACLALALSLGLFASLVTVLVELLHQALQQRARDLKGMLGCVFDAVFDGTRAAGQDLARLRADFTATLRSDRTLDALVRSHGTLLKRIAGRRMANDTAMTLETFFRRLERAEVYRTYLKTLVPEEQERLLNALAEQFGRAEAAISEFFRVRARLVSYLVGVGLAVTANVDAVRLFEHFAASPAATEVAIADLQALLAEAPAAGQGQAWTPPTAAQRQEATALLDRLRASQAFGLPVGWAYYPYCLPQPDQVRLDPRCPAPTDQSATPPANTTAKASAPGPLETLHAHVQPLFWLFSVLVTGFLIGLGGPYWFDLALTLGRLRDYLKTGQAKPAGQPPSPPDPAALVAAFMKKTTQP